MTEAEWKFFNKIFKEDFEHYKPTSIEGLGIVNEIAKKLIQLKP